MVLPRFVAQALLGEPITVYGSGEHTRCFAHVVEVVRALADLARAPEARGRVFNVGSAVETTVLDLATLVRRTRREPLDRSCASRSPKCSRRGSRIRRAGCPVWNGWRA
jgi:nucleoside-diphosphate-sugar epimerase